MKNKPILMKSLLVVIVSSLIAFFILNLLLFISGFEFITSGGFYFGCFLFGIFVAFIIEINNTPILMRSILIVFYSSLMGSCFLAVLISSSGFELLKSDEFYFGCVIFSLFVTFIIGLALMFRCLKGLILFVVFSFLYVPMLMLVIYSFNSSRLVTVWAEFSIKWYFELVNNEALLSAVGLSLLIAAGSATMATVFGTLASYTIIRFKRFKGSNLFSFMTTAPLVMPDVITGLALLLLFVSMGQIIGWPTDRGAITIWMAHVTFCTAYVTVVVSARLRELDKSIEEAALDLGANPLKVFFIITLPMIAPALVSGWLLAFTLSLDDLVIASFVAGPGATTLPMLIFSKVRLGVDPQINALATIILLIVGVIGFISWIMMRKAEKRRAQEVRMQ